jgi:hypothetical protein
MTKETIFCRGQRVRKKGGYTFEGRIQAVWNDTEDPAKIRLAVKLINPGGNGHGMIHIFSPEQMEPLP